MRTGGAHRPLAPQRRPGSHRGKGGTKLTGNKSKVCEEHVAQVQYIPCNSLISIFGCRPEDLHSFCEVLSISICRLISATFTQVSFTLPPQSSALATKSVLSLMKGKPRVGYEVLQGPFLDIFYKMSGTVRAGTGNAMERYAACTWLDTEGFVHYMCVGRTKYRIFSSSRQELQCKV